MRTAPVDDAPRFCPGCDREVEREITNYLWRMATYPSPRRPFPGRPRIWCSDACRMRTYRRQARALGEAEGSTSTGTAG